VRLQPRTVIAVVVKHHDKICVLKRSRWVRHDAGRWHCVTGYLSEDRDAEEQAITELSEEIGLSMTDLKSLQQGITLNIPDDQGHQWTIYTFSCDVTKTCIRLNWEHDSYQWLHPSDLSRIALVPWFFDVLQAVQAPSGIATSNDVYVRGKQTLNQGKSNDPDSSSRGVLP
jgi:ADP-ribose pyrophosphatase YjhB (NUDIX family)